MAEPPPSLSPLPVSYEAVCGRPLADMGGGGGILLTSHMPLCGAEQRKQPVTFNPGCRQPIRARLVSKPKISTSAKVKMEGEREAGERSAAVLEGGREGGRGRRQCVGGEGEAGGLLTYRPVAPR